MDFMKGRMRLMDCADYRVFLERAVAISDDIEMLMADYDPLLLIGVDQKTVHVKEGIDAMAATVGAELRGTYEAGCSDYPYWIYFEYGGKRVLQMESKRPEFPVAWENA